MTGPSTTREALIAETIGDLARLLDRAEALESAMAQSRQALADAHAQLAEQLNTFEVRVTALTEKVKAEAVKSILVRTDDATRRSLDTQTKAMNEAAQALFRSEVEPAMQRIAAPLRQLMQGVIRPWESWLMQVTAAVLASALSWACAAWLWTR